MIFLEEFEGVDQEVKPSSGLYIAQLSPTRGPASPSLCVPASCYSEKLLPLLYTALQSCLATLPILRKPRLQSQGLISSQSVWCHIHQSLSCLFSFLLLFFSSSLPLLLLSPPIPQHPWSLVAQAGHELKSVCSQG